MIIILKTAKNEYRIHTSQVIFKQYLYLFTDPSDIEGRSETISKIEITYGIRRMPYP